MLYPYLLSPSYERTTSTFLFNGYNFVLSILMYQSEFTDFKFKEKNIGRVITLAFSSKTTLNVLLIYILIDS